MNNKQSHLLGNLFIILLLVISFLVWIRVYETHSIPENKGLTVTFLNVGQGDSILIQTPGKKNILIDGGTYPRQWSTFDAGKMVVVPELKKRHIKKLDLVIATHPDLDHIGGLIAVLKKYPVGLFLDSGTIATTQTYEDLLKIIEKKKIKYKIAKPGKLEIDPEIELEVLSPIDPSFINNPNENSSVIRLSYGKISFLLTGDIGNIAEACYVEKYGNNLNSNILKLAHHGSNSSSSQHFLDHVQPEIAIISCGRNNPFGHPAKDILQRIENINIPIYRTDKSGAISINTDGETYTIETKR